jgi:opacity protein-like surface antigen
MKASYRTLLSATALALLATALPALAADYDPPIVIDQPVEEVPVEVGSGWYLRGDIGYNFTTKGDGNFDYRTYDPVTGTFGNDGFDTASLNNQITGGIGFGYNFTDMIRADFTVDGFFADFDGTTSSPLPCVDPVFDPRFAGTSCRSSDSSEAGVLSLLVNGYVDLGTYVGITPYVGAGVGYSYVSWDPLDSSVFCAGATCPVNLVGTGQVDGEESWRFTYALMAGAAYDVADNVKLDLGYRFRQIDDGPMFKFDPASGTTGTQGDDTGFTTHEVRLGVRYALW